MPSLALGLRVGRRHVLSAYGPELIPAGAWTLAGTGGTDTGSTITYSGGSNAATAAKAVTLEDGATYLVAFTLSGTTGGGVKTQTYGATTGHLGSGTTRTADGDYSEEITTSSAGSLTHTFRFQATGASGTNSYTIRNISLRKKVSA